MKPRTLVLFLRSVIFFFAVAACLVGVTILSTSILAQTTTSQKGPANLVATAASAVRVDLTWQWPSSTEQGFKVERASDRAFSRDLKSFAFSLPAGSAMAYADKTVVQSYVYYYRAKSVSPAGDSAWSNTAIVLTPYLTPKAPTNLAAQSNLPFQVNLVWQDNADNEAGFKIERATNSAFSANLKTFTSEANSINCTDWSVAPGTYYYRVRAFNRSATSPLSNVVDVTVGDKFDAGPTLVGFDTAQVVASGFTSAAPFFQADRLGVVQNQDISLVFSDLKGFVNFAQGTALRDASGNPLWSVLYTRPNLVPVPPSGRLLVQAAELGPSFSTFAPPVQITLIYDPLTLPESVDPSRDFTVAYWDGKGWKNIGNLALDEERHEVAFTVDHFSTFALFRVDDHPLQGFTVSDLHVFPESAEPGQPVVVYVEVTNHGPDPGNYNVDLKLNGKLEERRSISLDIGETAQVSFDLINKPSGSYEIDLNGLRSQLAIKPLEENAVSSPTPVPSPAASLSPVPSSNPLPEPAEPSPASLVQSPQAPADALPPETAPTPIRANASAVSSGLVGGSVGGVAILGGATFFLFYRLRHRKKQSAKPTSPEG